MLLFTLFCITHHKIYLSQFFFSRFCLDSVDYVCDFEINHAKWYFSSNYCLFFAVLLASKINTFGRNFKCYLLFTYCHTKKLNNFGRKCIIYIHNVFSLSTNIMSLSILFLLSSLIGDKLFVDRYPTIRIICFSK